MFVFPKQNQVITTVFKQFPERNDYFLENILMKNVDIINLSYFYHITKVFLFNSIHI